MSAEEEPLNLRSVRAPKHPGVSDAVCEALSEAAEVCLARHHAPPYTLLHIVCDGRKSDKSLIWLTPTETAQRTWGNRDDTTRDAAYIVSLAVVEYALGLVALSRADTRTGADYYVGRLEQYDLEEAFRLEVSGLDRGGLADIRRRLSIREDQVRRGRGFLPAYASIVGFREAVVLIGLVRESQDE